MIYKVIEDKTITWFENTNQYTILENTTADIIKRLQKEIPVKDIAKRCLKKLRHQKKKLLILF